MEEDGPALGSMGDGHFASPNLALDPHEILVDIHSVAGGVPVSTWKMRQRRHAEDGSLASLIIEPKQNC